MNDLTLHAGLVLAGLVALYFGAEWLVNGSVAVAKFLKIPALIIGLTVVAFGTSAPELFVGVSLNNAGYAGTSVGNVVGSNICNILLMLGLAAVIRPLPVHKQIVYREIPIMLGATLLFLVFVWDWKITRVEGSILFAGIIAYVAWNAWQTRQGREVEIVKRLQEGVVVKEVEPNPKHLILGLFLVVLGVAVLAAGAESLQRGAIFLAQHFGVNEAIIGLTLVAVGTSLPEIATSVVASLKNQGDIITGNAIGSNIFNILSVLGITALIKAMNPIEGILLLDLGLMLGVSILSIPFLMTRWTLGRTEGIIMLAIYGAYIALLSQR